MEGYKAVPLDRRKFKKTNVENMVTFQLKFCALRGYSIRTLRPTDGEILTIPYLERNITTTDCYAAYCEAYPNKKNEFRGDHFGTL